MHVGELRGVDLVGGRGVERVREHVPCSALAPSLGAHGGAAPWARGEGRTEGRGRRRAGGGDRCWPGRGGAAKGRRKPVSGCGACENED